MTSIVISKFFHCTGHNKCKELLSTKLQFNLDKNLMWLGSWMLLEALFHCKEGFQGLPLKNVMDEKLCFGF